MAPVLLWLRYTDPGVVPFLMAMESRLTLQPFGGLWSIVGLVAVSCEDGPAGPYGFNAVVGHHLLRVVAREGALALLAGEIDEGGQPLRMEEGRADPGGAVGFRLVGDGVGDIPLALDERNRFIGHATPLAAWWREGIHDGVDSIDHGVIEGEPFVAHFLRDGAVHQTVARWRGAWSACVYRLRSIRVTRVLPAGDGPGRKASFDLPARTPLIAAAGDRLRLSAKGNETEPEAGQRLYLNAVQARTTWTLAAADGGAAREIGAGEITIPAPPPGDYRVTGRFGAEEATLSITLRVEAGAGS
ncbi:MAG: hypothetical protein HY719_13385 [Planctomycetes bacterium]|nr:hypothetical protein [Planctomycetota bacterium]